MANKPEDLFDIIQEERVHTRTDGSTFTTRPYYIVYKVTGEKYFPKSRPYGYSGLRDAQRARTRLFNDHVRALEKCLLGTSE